MVKYLYGASVQGIQRFIFDSSRLKEIAGASELIESICTSSFDEISTNFSCERIIQAAGNIRTIFTCKDELAKVCKIFPKKAMLEAPGVNILQAVVAFEGELSKDIVDVLEQKLRLAVAMPPIEDSWSVIARAPRTGKSAVKLKPYNEAGERVDELQDSGMLKKLSAEKSRNILIKKFTVEKAPEDFPTEMDAIADSNSYLAVIHADGNSLGQVLANLPIDESYKEMWSNFSQKLDEATTAAARTAFADNFSADENLKFRPILLGGDDLTVVCCASKAIAFTKVFLNSFAKECSERKADFMDKELTACAGIAFVKKSYPFYFAVRLAEQLCSEAKKLAKVDLLYDEAVPSCLMFHRELSSFVESSYDQIKKRELLHGEINFAFGPYKVDSSANLPDLDNLIKAADAINASAGGYNRLRSGLRQYLSELSINPGQADFLLDRLETVAQEKAAGKQALKALKENLSLLCASTIGSSASLKELVRQKRNTMDYSPVADIISLGTLLKQTK